MQRRRDDIIGGIQHVDAAVSEFCEIVRLEDDVPTVDFAVRTEPITHRLCIEPDAGRAPHVVDGVLIAGIVSRETARDFWPDILEILKLVLVEFLEDAGLDLPLEEVPGRDDDIVTRFSGDYNRG